jgi:hypothetical protein
MNHPIFLEKLLQKNIRSRHAVKPRAVQPVVIRTAYWAGIGKYEK